MLGEIKTLPFGGHLCWISLREVRDECKNDPTIAPLDTNWPSYLDDCSKFIIGMMPYRQTLMFRNQICRGNSISGNEVPPQTLMFRIIYDQICRGNSISGYEFPPFTEFSMLEEYRNAFYDFTIYLEALVLSKYVKMSLKRSAKVSFDTLQETITAMCQNDPIARDTLKLLMEERDISELNISS